jgi:hypothetical protein
MAAVRLGGPVDTTLLTGRTCGLTLPPPPLSLFQPGQDGGGSHREGLLVRRHGGVELRLESLIRRAVHPLRPRRWGLLVMAVITAEPSVEPSLSGVRPARAGGNRHSRPIVIAT